MLRFLNQIVLFYILKFPTCSDLCSPEELIILRANNTYLGWWLKRELTKCVISTHFIPSFVWESNSCLKRESIKRLYKDLVVPYRLKKFYIEAAAASNITIPNHPVTFDPEASWLQFHLGINRYALYSRDDGIIDRLLRDMQTARVISAGQREINPGSVWSNAVHDLILQCLIVSDRFHSGWESTEGCMWLLTR